MKVLGIIAEYNPMHTGHIYHINEAKKITNSDYVIAIMSGSFTEQGNIAILDKFTRAKEAVNSGVDLVIELPTIYAVSDGGSFANKAIQLLNDLNVVDSICFGAETDNISKLNNIANTIIVNDDKIWNDIKENLKKGISFANARNESLKKYLKDDEINLVNTPNNILGIEYLKSIITLKSNITPYCIKRESSNFNDDTITQKYTSSTSIRKYLEEGKDIQNISEYISKNTLNSILNSKVLFNKDIFELLKYKIITMSNEELRNIYGITEGLENKIQNEILDSYTYEDFIFKLKSKRYELSKIKRMLIHILLDTTKEDFDNLKNCKSNYAHILAFNHDKKDLLSYISKNSKIPILTSINDNTLAKLTQNQRKLIDYDLNASNIYSILNETKLNQDYTNML